MDGNLVTLSFWIIAALVVFVIIKSTIQIVPQQHAFVVERLGKFDRTLSPGLGFTVPFLEKVAYRHSLKEMVLDVASQVCITKDNTQLKVDGVLYYQVTDPRQASYGSTNYVLAISNLAQTSLRSVIGKLEMDETFEKRDLINLAVVKALDEAATNWGVKVLRYEISDLTPPEEILRAMQLQITAERTKRALVTESEGKKQEDINIAQGNRQAAILKSEGEQQSMINYAQGEAQALLTIAQATAESLERVARATQTPGGMDAVNLSVAERYVDAFKEVAQKNNTLILPANMGDMGSMIAGAMTMMKATKPVG
ncbi:SPFH domain-containing protein [Pusillimonas sp. ANT_WB101]|uniref:SPFH domain-containing protein n=1 Tax=Pusillimonas sp. ANT_WB101 TaxID=2597356 RepID=UPI0011EF9E5B|nr:SPFH domain-containing protein [Pusillimonas sp. ANT_WB101]KAA0911491.1 SPFH/Band 7/PHB domain protein [Pusillimonas sp. ANT_WB101]NYT78038.1 SPFH/Band 7/PHB domain protein [Alcaligenaceae bacterium]